MVEVGVDSDSDVCCDGTDLELDVREAPNRDGCVTKDKATTGRQAATTHMLGIRLTILFSILIPMIPQQREAQSGPESWTKKKIDCVACVGL
jgi:hypothetical protein